MGNTTTASKVLAQAKQLNYEELRQNSTFDGEIVEDYRYGSGLIITNHHLKIKLLLQTQTYTLLSQYEQICSEAQNRLLVTNPTVVQLIKFNGTEYINSHGKSFKISLLYEFHQMTLQDEIIQRAKNQQQYDELQLYTLIDHVISTLLVFQSLGVRHSFIQPSSVFVSEQHYKINDVQFMSGQNEYKRFQLGFRDSCYLSPKLFENLGHRAQNPAHSYEKSEVFSIARCVLEAAVLQNVSELLYDFNTYRINKVELEGVLYSLEDRYSKTFCHLMRAMLDIDEESRFSYADIILTIKSHLQESISVSIQREIKIRNEGFRGAQQHELSPLSFRQMTHKEDLERLFHRSPEKSTYGQKLEQLKSVKEEYSFYNEMGTFGDRNSTEAKSKYRGLSPTPSPFKSSYSQKPDVTSYSAVQRPPKPKEVMTKSQFIGVEVPHSPLQRMKNKKSSQVSPLFTPPKQTSDSQIMQQLTKQNESQQQKQYQYPITVTPLKRGSQNESQKQKESQFPTTTTPQNRDKDQDFIFQLTNKSVSQKYSDKELPKETNFHQQKQSQYPVDPSNTLQNNESQKLKQSQNPSNQQSRAPSQHLISSTVEHNQPGPSLTRKNSAIDHNQTTTSQIQQHSFIDHNQPHHNQYLNRSYKDDNQRTPNRSYKDDNQRTPNQYQNHSLIDHNQPAPTQFLNRSAIDHNQPDHSQLQNRQTEDNNQFKNLAPKLENLEGSFQKVPYRRSIIEQNITPQKDHNARLPQSDVIHMHSGNSQFLNDVFTKDTKDNKKLNKFKESKNADDFWN